MKLVESKIKKRLEQYQSEIDPDEIWEGIQRKKYKKKKIRKKYLMISAVFLLFLYFSQLMIFHQKDKTPSGYKSSESYKGVFQEQNTEIAPGAGKNTYIDSTNSVSAKR